MSSLDHLSACSLTLLSSDWGDLHRPQLPLPKDGLHDAASNQAGSNLPGLSCLGLVDSLRERLQEGVVCELMSAQWRQSTLQDQWRTFERTFKDAKATETKEVM